MSMTVWQSAIDAEDRAAIEKQAADYLSHGASPTVPFVVGLIGVIAVAVAFQSMRATTGVGILLLAIPGCVMAVGGLLLAAGRRQYQRVMQVMAARIRRNLADADEVTVYEVEAQAGCVVEGDSDAFDQEWSGAVVRTVSGSVLFVEALVTIEFPRDGHGVVRVPRTMEVRTLPTHDLVRVVLSDDGVEETLELTEQDVMRLGKWVVEDLDDGTAPCREIPAGVLA